MKSTKNCIIVGAITLFSASGANAAIYSNPNSETPFNLSLDTGSLAWQSPSATLQSASTTNTWQSQSTSSTGPVTTSADPKVGVPGFYDISTTTTTYTYNESSSNQSLNIGYSAGLTGPLAVPETFVLTGQINKMSGAALYSSGSGYLSFNMGMNVNFVNPYAPDTANGILTFKLGSAPGTWNYQFQTPFNTSSGSVSLANSQSLDFNTATYFEADYSIGGNTGVQFGISNLSLNVGGGLNGPRTETLISTVPKITTLYHFVIPALAPPLTTVPVPAAAWLLGSGLIGMIGVARRKAA